MGDSSHKLETLSPPVAPAVRPSYQDETFIEHEGEGYRVMLYNDEVHTRDAVVAQIIKAVGCPKENAVAIMLRASAQGRAVVTITTREHAADIARVLREIALVVEVDLV